MRLVLIALTILISCRAQAFPGARDYAVNGCRIYAPTQVIERVLPGERCLFLENGDYISATGTTLRYYSGTGEVRWELNGHFHHQMNFTNDRKRILVISSVLGSMQREQVKRYDRLIVIGLDGKVTSSLDLHIALEAAGAKSISVNNRFGDVVAAELEGSHVNSFYEIPDLRKSSAPDWLKNATYVVNGLNHGVMFIDKDLKKILRIWKSPFSFFHNVHDAQITPSGSLIYFNNNSAAGSATMLYSSVDEIDLRSGYRTLEIKAEPEVFFFSRHSGGVQVLTQDLIMFSHAIAGYFVYSRQKRKIIFAGHAPYINREQLVTAQQIKIEDLTEFVKKKF